MYSGLFQFLRVNEHSEDSYIGLDIFFAALLLRYFQIQFIFFVKWQIISTVEQRNCSGHEKRDGLLVSRRYLLFRVPSGIKNLPTDQYFSNWVTFIEKRVNRKFFLKFKDLQGHIIFSLKFES